MLKKILLGLTLILTTVFGKIISAKNFSDLMRELEEVESEIKLTVDTIEAKNLQNQVDQSNPHVNFFTKRINHFMTYIPEKKVDYWKIISGMNARNKNLDMYGNKFMFTSAGRTI